MHTIFSALCEKICALHRCVIVRDGSVIATGSNLTNETRNVSSTFPQTQDARDLPMPFRVLTEVWCLK